jgi:hypothetical protein
MVRYAYNRQVTPPAPFVPCEDKGNRESRRTVRSARQRRAQPVQDLARWPESRTRAELTEMRGVLTDIDAQREVAFELGVDGSHAAIPLAG